jgi:hypothetical protein
MTVRPPQSRVVDSLPNVAGCGAFKKIAVVRSRVLLEINARKTLC